MNKDAPYVSKELVEYLKTTFKMPSYTLDKDIRKLDFISGQISIIEYLEKMNTNQQGK